MLDNALLTLVRDFCVFPSLFEEESSLQVQYLKLAALRDLVHFLRTFQVLPKVKVSRVHRLSNLNFIPPKIPLISNQRISKALLSQAVLVIIFAF